MKSPKYCPKCGKETRVIDSRDAETGVRRRRVCDDCGYRFTTLEITLEQIGIYNRQEHERNTILNTIREITRRYA